MADNNFRADMLQEAMYTYGIPISEDIKWDNERMIKALGDYYISLEPEKYSWGARYVQSLSTPMLCRHLKEDLKNFSINPTESDDYIAEVKMNGFRCLCVYTPQTGFEFYSRDESCSNYLRGNFTDKFLFMEKGIITEPKDYINKYNMRFVIDGELTVENAEEDSGTMGMSVEDYIQGILGSGAERARAFQKEGHKLKMTIFDVLYFEKDPKPEDEWTPQYDYTEEELTEGNIAWVNCKFGDYIRSAEFKSPKRAKKLYQYLWSLRKSNKFDIRRYPFYRRRQLRGKIANFLNKKGLPFEEVKSEDTFKIAFTDTILREGGEGSILKNLYAPYISGMKSSRGHRAAMKVKQSIQNMLDSSGELMEDFDVFITGANPPKSDRITDMIGSLSCSVYIKSEDGTVKEHEIANVSGLTHEWKRKLASIDDKGEITLNPEYKYKVISINGLALTLSKLKFQHATIKNNRIEFKAKNPTDCVWDEEVLKDMCLVRGK